MAQAAYEKWFVNKREKRKPTRYFQAVFFIVWDTLP